MDCFLAAKEALRNHCVCAWRIKSMSDMFLHIVESCLLFFFLVPLLVLLDWIDSFPKDIDFSRMYGLTKKNATRLLFHFIGYEHMSCIF